MTSCKTSCVEDNEGPRNNTLEVLVSKQIEWANGWLRPQNGFEDRFGADLKTASSKAAARSSQQAGSGPKKNKTSENAIYAVNYVPGGGVNEII